MHPYSTDSSERKWIPLFILLGSVPFAMGLKIFWESLHFNGVLGDFYYITSFFIDFSIIFFYELFYYLFDNTLWKYCHFIPSMKVPNLNGNWKGTLKSSYNDQGTEDRVQINATMQISQTWQKIEIRLKTDNSKSKTVTAGFFTNNPNAIELSYQYQNEPNANAEINTMHIHKGTGWITLAPDTKSFEGEYYNGRDSKNHGCLKFNKVEC
ncbi:MAG: hypothetical protein PHQ17_03120 [Methanobacterium sp.]|nr:hypothetical protein [Methanobacterium sp.]